WNSSGDRHNETNECRAPTPCRRPQGRHPLEKPPMHPIALTRSSIILPTMAFLRRIGAPVERHLARCGLPAWISTDPEALIPTSGVVRLLNEAARSEGIDDLGLRAGLEAPVDAFGFLGRRVSRLPTLRQLLHVALRHHSAFSSSGRMWVDSQGEQVRVCLAFTACFDGDWQQADHYVLMLILALLRLGAGATWRPAAVQLQTIQCDAVSNFEPLSTARINFAQPVTAVTFPRMLLDATLQPPRGDAGALDQGVDAWQASAPADDFIGSIFQVIQTLSRDGYPNTQQTADVLGLGVRSSQR